MKHIYSIGICKVCGKITALKNGVCLDCQDKEFPDIFNDLFNNKEE